MRWYVTAISTFVGLLLATMSAASAAPQTLLLVANDDDLQFRCAGGECFAEATTMCLQYERASPSPGTPYELVEEARYGTGRPGGVSLIGMTAGGGEKSLPLEALRIVSERDHMSTRFIVAESLLKQHGLEAVRLRIAHNVVLAPVWQVGDAKPQMEPDIELSMGPLRATAERILTMRQSRVAAAGIMRDTLNALPRNRVASSDERIASFEQAVAKRTAKTGSRAPEAALAEAKQALNSCSYIKDGEMWYRAFHTRISRYRDCLGQRHDALIKDVNQTYWKAARAAGS